MRADDLDMLAEKQKREQQPIENWREFYEGSGPTQGWNIVDGTGFRVACLGDAVDPNEVSAICALHNEALSAAPTRAQAASAGMSFDEWFDAEHPVAEHTNASLRMAHKAISQVAWKAGAELSTSKAVNDGYRDSWLAVFDALSAATNRFKGMDTNGLGVDVAVAAVKLLADRAAPTDDSRDSSRSAAYREVTIGDVLKVLQHADGFLFDAVPERRLRDALLSIHAVIRVSDTGRTSSNPKDVEQ